MGCSHKVIWEHQRTSIANKVEEGADLFNTTFIDFIIDGKSLYNTLKSYDFISVLVQGEDGTQREKIQK